MTSEAATPDIPVEVEDITAAWCTEILQRHAPGAEVTAIEVLAAHSGTTGRARIGITGDDRRLPPSVFVKLAPFSEERRSFVAANGMGVAEARFYEELAGEVPVHVPAVWHAAHDQAGRYVMVLQDLAAAGASFPRPRDPDSEAVAEAVVGQLARLHGAFHASPRFGPEGDLAWIEEKSRTYGSAAALVAQGVDRIGDRMPASFHRLAAVYIPHADAVAALVGQGPRTLVHGDAHLGNMFVLDGRPGFLDWAVLGFGPGVRDVAYFLGNSVTTEVRRRRERDFLDGYCEILGQRGVRLTPDLAWDQYRRQMITSWVAAVVTAGFGSALQPIDIVLRGVARANHSIEDLDVADLLREELGGR